MQIVCIWSSWCHCHPKTPSSLASFISRLVLPFWYRFIQVVLEKRPLNGCRSVSGSSSTSIAVCPKMISNHALTRLLTLSFWLHNLPYDLLCIDVCTVCVSVGMPSVLWRCWLGGKKGIRPVKKWVVGCRRGYLSGARCRLAYGPADATATHCLLLQ